MNYDFMMLSPYDFEQLVCDLLSKSLGVRLESFKEGKDSGIDLRHSLSLEGSGDLIVQCKRYAVHKFSELKRSLSSELINLNKLQPNRYIIATSVALSPKNKQDLIKILTPWVKSNDDIYSPADLNKLIRDFPEIERAHFKLWISSTAVLEKILNARIFSQTDASLEQTRRHSSKLVAHSGLNIAIELLQKNHHILIVGNPGIGKTTLAKMIMCHYMEDGFEPVWLFNNIEDVWSLIHSEKASEQRLIIVYDDFLGRLRFNSEKFEKNEDRALLALIDYVSNLSNIRLILTTREYILEDAKRMHGSFDDRANELVKYTLSLDEYARSERAQILFNHLYFSDLPDERLKKLIETKAYRDVITHNSFNPRVVEIVCNYANSRALSVDEFIAFFKKEFDNPITLWAHPFKQEISPMAQKILLALWSFDGKVEINTLKQAVALFYPKSNGYEVDMDFSDAIRQLDGNFILSNRFKGVNRKKEYIIIQFQNPSVEEFIESLAKEYSTLLSLIDVCVVYEQIEKLLDLSERINFTFDEFFNNLKVKFIDCQDKFSGRILNFILYNEDTAIKTWVLNECRKASVILTLLKLEKKINVSDQRKNEGYLHVMTKQGWREILSSIPHRQAEVYYIYSLQKWILNSSGWSDSDITTSQFNLRTCVLELLNEDDAYLTDKNSIDKLIETLTLYPLPLSEDLTNAILSVVKSSFDHISLYQLNVSELEEEIEGVKNIAKKLNINLDTEIMRLESKIFEKTDEEENDNTIIGESHRYENISSNDMDIDKLFKSLIER
ncbi:restriction endonuclease [Citrobacter portucalensis]|uniref:nSTAND3 domain-containing NTPase n=1 Tax=Citrobacter portucalensis TaxID=1639133 RepID=UPI0039FD34DB